MLVQDFNHTLHGLPASLACGMGCHEYLDIRNGPSPHRDRARPYRMIQEDKLNHVPPVISYRVLGYKARAGHTPQFTVQYWLLYLWNSLTGDFHEGDLEEVTIHTQNELRPQEAFFSEHVAGTVRPWGPRLETRSRRVVTYVATGSHANYFSTGVERTIVHCPKRRGEEDVACDEFGGIAGDYADGCGNVWLWKHAGAVEPPDSTVPCREAGFVAPRFIRYDLRPWHGHAVDWGAPKTNYTLGTDWVPDPSIRVLLWTDAVGEMRRDACYTLETKS